MRASLVILLLLLLAAGGASSQAAGEGRVTGVVAFAQDDLSNDWRQAQVDAVRQVLAQYPGVEFRVTDARGDAAVQALHIERLAKDGVDVLITSPANAALVGPVIRQVRAQGTPVLLLTRRAKGAQADSFVHPNDRRITQRLARFLFDRLDHKGRILMLQGVPTATPTQHRTRTFRELAAQHGDITITTRTANYLRGDAIKAVDRILRAHDGAFPFDAIYAQSDSMAVGARIALRRAGIDPAGLLIAGIDYIQAARRAIRTGEQAVSFTYPTGGAEGARLAIRLLRGQDIPDEIRLQSQRVTATNVETVAPIF
ncbi:MAG TPA: substrate-binding domain-containing protein [Gammaproteobacteria bacterium]|nr:substrate-binding domain-containing protein [Gammaproteobacteria bacterium]